MEKITRESGSVVGVIGAECGDLQGEDPGGHPQKWGQGVARALQGAGILI